MLLTPPKILIGSALVGAGVALITRDPNLGYAATTFMTGGGFALFGVERGVEGAMERCQAQRAFLLPPPPTAPIVTPQTSQLQPSDDLAQAAQAAPSMHADRHPREERRLQAERPVPPAAPVAPPLVIRCCGLQMRERWLAFGGFAANATPLEQPLARLVSILGVVAREVAVRDALIALDSEADTHIATVGILVLSGPLSGEMLNAIRKRCAGAVVRPFGTRQQPALVVHLAAPAVEQVIAPAPRRAGPLRRIPTPQERGGAPARVAVPQPAPVVEQEPVVEVAPAPIQPPIAAPARIAQPIAAPITEPMAAPVTQPIPTWSDEPLFADDTNAAPDLSAALDAYPFTSPRWSARTLWPEICFGIHPDTGEGVWGPMEQTCIFAGTQTGKTTLIQHLMAQVSAARQEASGRGISPWFMTTKWQDTNNYGVNVGQWLGTAYNLRRFSSPRGNESDAMGSFRMLELLAGELQKRATRPDAASASRVVAFIDEWAYTAALLNSKRFVRDDRKPTAPAGTIVEAGLDTPLGAAAANVATITRLGQGMGVLAFFVSQDGAIRNNSPKPSAINTGMFANFGTFLVHLRRLDQATRTIVVAGNPATAERLDALRERWQEWAYIRGDVVEPFVFPHVTNDTIAAWMRRVGPLPTGETQPAARPMAQPTAPLATPATLATARPTALPTTPATTPAAVGDLSAWGDNAAYLERNIADLHVVLRGFAHLGLTLPQRLTLVQRRRLLGLEEPQPPTSVAFCTLLRALARNGISQNALATLVFNTRGEATADIGRMLKGGD